MPAQPTWFQRLDDILSELRALGNDYLDRQGVEKVFGVRERRARQLMAGLPALQIGNAVAVSRNALIERLETTAAGDCFQWEAARRARVADSLESLRKRAAARRVQIAAAPDVRNRVAKNLGAGIELQRGELRIRFDGARDLASKLFELSQAMANDWEEFEQTLTASAPPATGRTALRSAR